MTDLMTNHITDLMTDTKTDPMANPMTDPMTDLMTEQNCDVMAVSHSYEVFRIVIKCQNKTISGNRRLQYLRRFLSSFIF